MDYSKAVVTTTQCVPGIGVLVTHSITFSNTGNDGCIRVIKLGDNVSIEQKHVHPLSKEKVSNVVSVHTPQELAALKALLSLI
jgi:hypothetical protein